MLNITRGKINRAQKVVIYGSEGIGKTSLAARFPDPVIIDTEGGTAHMDVRRIDKPASWDELLSIVREVAATPGSIRRTGRNSSSRRIFAKNTSRRPLSRSDTARAIRFSERNSPSCSPPAIPLFLRESMSSSRRTRRCGNLSSRMKWGRMTDGR